ncbi:MAG: DUF2480 family protein [Chitinophagaceae bacterium]
MEETFVNKVAESGLLTIDPASFIPVGGTMVFDLKSFLFMELILKEKDFREALKSTNWEDYRDKNVAVICSADAIVPVWAYMLVATYLEPVARYIYMGSEAELEKQLFLNNLSAIDLSLYQDKRVVIKGCGDVVIGDFVYMEITRLLRPVVKSIMYGEPCSTVPVYKKRSAS